MTHIQQMLKMEEGVFVQEKVDQWRIALLSQANWRAEDLISIPKGETEDLWKHKRVVFYLGIWKDLNNPSKCNIHKGKIYENELVFSLKDSIHETNQQKIRVFFAMSKSGKQLCTQKSKQKAEILTADKKNEQDIRIFIKVKKLYKAILSLITFLWMCRSSLSPFLSEFYLPLGCTCFWVHVEGRRQLHGVSFSSTFT